MSLLTKTFTQQTIPLLRDDLEDNYGTDSRLQDRTKLPFSSTFTLFLAHVRPSLSLTLILILQRITIFYLPYLSSLVVQSIFQFHSEQIPGKVEVLKALAYYLSVRFLEKLLDESQNPLWIRIVQECRRFISETALYNSLKLDNEWYDEHGTSETLSIIRKYRTVDKVITEASFSILPTVFDIIFAVCYASYRFDLWCAIQFMVSALILLCFIIWSGGYTAQLEENTSWAKDHTNEIRYVREDSIPAKERSDKSPLRSNIVHTHETIQILQKEDEAVNELDTAICNGQATENRVVDWASASVLIQELIFSVCIFLLIARSISTTNVNPVDITALYNYSIQLQKQLSTLGDSFRRLGKYWVVGRQILEFVKLPITVDIPNAKKLSSCRGHVKFENVKFGYKKKKKLVLNGISFECKPGESTVFVGTSGIGKSTIWKLMVRSYSVRNGHVRIDGHDVQDLTQESIRSHIGVVPQDPKLIRNTIFANLSYANRDLSRKEIEDKAISLGFHNRFLELGYETNVGENGSCLSGGERMMVAVTMSVIRNPSILVFDEATAPFDAETAQVCQGAIEGLKSSRTVILISYVTPHAGVSKS